MANGNRKLGRIIATEMDQAGYGEESPESVGTPPAMIFRAEYRRNRWGPANRWQPSDDYWRYR
jgi:hypothetical protein